MGGGSMAEGHRQRVAKEIATIAEIAKIEKQNLKQEAHHGFTRMTWIGISVDPVIW
jgi:hypothetical protein